LLKSLHANANVAVFGASGGIGGAFVEQLAADPSIATVHAFSRTPTEFAHAKVVARSVAYDNEDALRDAARVASSDQPLDLVIVASGILHRAAELRPEKSLRELSADSMAEVFSVNTILPAMLAKHFLPCLRREHKTVFAALSARVGSIADNRLGGWVSYRSSKAALNMVLKTLAIEHARRWPESVLVALHPGTVDTGLSKPFSSGVPENKLFSTAQSASYLLTVMDGLNAADTGGFYAWDGSRIPY
jgi:NAD(P)-dependent dehydrogenase (short-subunit alcohol dehydrogenase family)